MASPQDIAQQVNSASSDPAPFIAAPESVYADLLIGNENGIEAEVRELTGEDEESLARFVTKKSPAHGDWITAVLQRSVVSVGGKSPGDLNKFINADRDILMLATVRATYGSVKDVRVTCRECKKSNDVEINLDEDFPSKLPDFDIHKPLHVSTAKGSVSMRIPYGEDLTAAAAVASDAEANTLILSRVALFPEGEEPTDRLQWARKLNTALRRKAIDVLLRLELGPNIGVVNTQCAHCEKDLAIGLDWVSLLLN